MNTQTLRINPLAVPLAGVAWAQFLIMLQVIAPYHDALTGNSHMNGRGRMLFLERFITSDVSTGNISMLLLVLCLVFFSASLMSAAAAGAPTATEAVWSIRATNALGFGGFMCWLGSIMMLLAFYDVFLVVAFWLGLLTCGVVSAFYRKNGSIWAFWRALAFKTVISVGIVQKDLS